MLRTISKKPSQDRRVTRRLDVDLAGLVRVASLPWVECRVRNISPMGAMIEFASPTILPRHFRLQIPNDLFEAECELRHQSGEVAGVLFVTNRAGALARYA